MRRRVAVVAVTVALLLAMPAVLLAWGFGRPAQFERSFMGELKDKAARLRDAPGPRIVLVGGSGVAFGVDSALMERELPGYSVVNFGMYAALGTTVMLDLSEPYIRAGDIVLLLPEQQAQTLSDWFDPTILWQGLDGAFELLSDLPGDKRARLAGAFPEFAGQKCGYALRGEAPEGEGVYRRDSFNEFGDVVSPLCARNEMPGGWDKNMPIRFAPEMLSDAFVERVRGYARTIERRGATLWYGCCPMNAAAVQGDAAQIDAFYAALQTRLGIPLAGNPHDFLLDAGWFFDTNFHPNAGGRTVYTRELIRAIKAMLGDRSPTQIALPAMPEPAGAADWRGDDSDADCFTYAQLDGAWAVTGLSDAGRARTSLTVPSSRNGASVTSIAANAFAGEAALTELVIQRNIRTIGDGAFDGCAALERIVLRQDAPSACRVGQNLLEGATAHVYVPPDALSAYRIDYFWSIHAPSILPEK